MRPGTAVEARKEKKRGTKCPIRAEVFHACYKHTYQSEANLDCGNPRQPGMCEGPHPRARACRARCPSHAHGVHNSSHILGWRFQPRILKSNNKQINKTMTTATTKTHKNDLRGVEHPEGAIDFLTQGGTGLMALFLTRVVNSLLGRLVLAPKRLRRLAVGGC